MPWFYDSLYTHHAQTLILTGSLGTEAGTEAGTGASSLPPKIKDARKVCRVSRLKGSLGSMPEYPNPLFPLMLCEPMACDWAHRASQSRAGTQKGNGTPAASRILTTPPAVRGEWVVLPRLFSLLIF